MRILITGGSGLVGKALEHLLSDDKNCKTFFLSSRDCDLTDMKKCIGCFDSFKPEYVIHLAAEVGGLFKNMRKKVELFTNNVKINMNVLECCHIFKVKKCISCLSTCIFPDNIEYPINEEMLHNGEPHYSNYGYAYAKRMLEIQSRLYYEQYGDKFVTIIPTNIYGKHDNFHLEDAHVIPALIHQCYLAKKENLPFQIRGTGKPLRQFIYSSDLALLIMDILENYDDKEPIILSVSEKEEISIEKVAKIIAEVMDYEENLYFEDGYSDGQYKKTASNTKMMKYLNYSFEFTPIKQGILDTVQWFIENYDNCRK